MLKLFYRCCTCTWKQAHRHLNLLALVGVELSNRNHFCWGTWRSIASLRGWKLRGWKLRGWIFHGWKLRGWKLRGWIFHGWCFHGWKLCRWSFHGWLSHITSATALGGKISCGGNKMIYLVDYSKLAWWSFKGPVCKVQWYLRVSLQTANTSSHTPLQSV